MGPMVIGLWRRIHVYIHLRYNVTSQAVFADAGVHVLTLLTAFLAVVEHPTRVFLALSAGRPRGAVTVTILTARGRWKREK